MKVTPILMAWAVLLSAPLAWSASFTMRKDFVDVGSNPTGLVGADLTGDGVIDLVTANAGALSDPGADDRPPDTLTVLIGIEDEGYADALTLEAGAAPYGIRVANIDALKAPDLLVVNFMGARERDLILYRNLGPGKFDRHAFSVPRDSLRYRRLRDPGGQPVFAVPGLTSLVVGDFNEDGLRDVVATGWSSDVLVFFPGHGESYLDEPSLIDALGGPRDVDTADLDGDGHLDLAVALYAADAVGIWSGDGNGAFSHVDSLPSRGRLPQRVRLVDMDGDGKRDMVVAHRHSSDSLVVFYGNGGWDFSVSQEILLAPNREAVELDVRNLLCADVTGDGRPDLVAACHESREVIVLINKSKSGELPQRFDRETYAFTDGRPSGLCSGDFDGDGDADIGVALSQTDRVAILLGKGAR
jgi:VCBS repeat protein